MRQNILLPPIGFWRTLFKNKQRNKHAVFQQAPSYFIDKKYINLNATKKSSDYTIARHVNPENQFINLEKWEPF